MLLDKVTYPDSFLALCNGKDDKFGHHFFLGAFSKFADVNTDMRPEEVQLYMHENCGVNILSQRDKKQYAVDIEKQDMNEQWNYYTKQWLNIWEKKKGMVDPDIISAATGLRDMRARITEILKQGYGTEEYEHSEYRLPRCANGTSKQFSLYEGHDVKKGDIVQVQLTSMVPWRGLLHDSMSRRIMVVENVDDDDKDDDKDEGASIKMVSAYGDLHHWKSLDVTEMSAFSPSNCALISWLLWVDPGRIFYNYNPTLTPVMKTLAVTEKDCALEGLLQESSGKFQHFVCTELAFQKPEDNEDKPTFKYGYYLFNNKLPDVVEQENKIDGQRTSSRHRSVVKSKLIAYLSTLAGSNLSSKDNLLFMLHREENGMEIQAFGSGHLRLPCVTYRKDRRVILSVRAADLVVQNGDPRSEHSLFYKAVDNVQRYMDMERQRMLNEGAKEEDLFDGCLMDEVEQYLEITGRATVVLDGKTEYLNFEKDSEKEWDYTRSKLKNLGKMLEDYNCFQKPETLWERLKMQIAQDLGPEPDYLLLWLTQACDSLTKWKKITMPRPVLISSAADAPYGLVAADPKVKKESTDTKRGKASTKPWQETRAEHMNRMSGGKGLCVEHEVLLQAFVKAAFVRYEECEGFDELTYARKEAVEAEEGADGQDGEKELVTKYMRTSFDWRQKMYGGQERIAHQADIIGRLAANFEQMWKVDE